MRAVVNIVLLIAILFGGLVSVVDAGPAFPIKISESGRHLVDQNGVPFLIHGDSPWSLIGQLSKEDAESYLQDCAAKGINTLNVTLIERYYADTAPANFYGVQPFTTPNKISTPNEAYFEHADWVINKAAELGIMINLAPLYLGCCEDSEGEIDGWVEELHDLNTVEDARLFGEWIGNRYKSFPNLIYVWGGDRNPDWGGYDVREKVRAMAEGADSVDPNHLMTYHTTQPYSPLDVWSYEETWLDLNNTYTYSPVQDANLINYHRTEFRPYFFFEGIYENIDPPDDGTPKRIRRQAYTALLSGAAGQIYGEWPLWHFNGRPGDDGNTWRDHLNVEGRVQMRHVRTLFEAREWYNLVPDDSHEFITEGIGSENSYVAAAVSADGRTAIVYIPEESEGTIQADMSQITGVNAVCRWYDPRTGNSTMIGEFPCAGERTFVRPTDSDWVLIIDDATLAVGAPALIHVTTQSAPVGLVAEEYQAQLMGAGGMAPYSWELAPGSASLPPGLHLSSSGLISGTPSVSGVFPLIFRIIDRFNNSAQQSIPITISAGPLSVPSAQVPDAKRNVAYSTQMVGSGGVGPYAWSLAPNSPPLPPGLSLSSTGILSGTPAASGAKSFTVVLTDAVGDTVDQVVSLMVAPAVVRIVLNPQSSQEIDQNGFQMTISADAPGTFLVEYSTDFNEWEELESFEYESGQVEIADVDATSAIPKFYRVRQLE